MEAGPGLVKHLPAVKIHAEAGEQLRAEQHIFVPMRADVDFTMAAMAAMTRHGGVVAAVASPNGIPPRR